jgi:hypothetical protein
MAEQVKLLLSYDIRTGRENAYRRFILEEFLPQAQTLGLVATDAWHTAYGNYPARLIAFVADNLETVQTARASEPWGSMMKKLAGYTINLTERVVRLRGGFQW